MAAPIIGIDIGATGVRAVALTEDANPTVIGAGHVALTPGAVNAQGIHHAEAVTDAVRDAVAQTGQKKAKKAAVALGGSSVVIRDLTLPELPYDSLKSTLLSQVGELLSFPVSDAETSHLVLERFRDDEGAANLRVLFIAARTELVNSHLEVVKAAGLTPMLADHATFASLRAYVPSARAAAFPSTVPATECQAIVDIGGETTHVIIHAGGIPHLIRTLGIGGEDITRSLMGVSQLGKLDHEKATTAKLKVGVRDLPPPMGDETQPGIIAARLIDEAAERLVGDIASSIEFHSSRPRAPQVTDIGLIGRGAALPGLAERMQTRTGIRVTRSGGLGIPGLVEDGTGSLTGAGHVAVGMALGAAKRKGGK